MEKQKERRRKEITLKAERKEKYGGIVCTVDKANEKGID